MSCIDCHLDKYRKKELKKHNALKKNYIVDEHTHFKSDLIFLSFRFHLFLLMEDTHLPNPKNDMSIDDGTSLTNSSLKNRIIQMVTDLVVITLILVIFAVVYLSVDPKIRFFTCNDTDIFFPYRPDTVPFWAVGIFGALGPLVSILLIELLNARILPFQQSKGRSVKQRKRKFFVCFFHGLSLFVLGISLTLCLTDIGKRWVILISSSNKK
jgi:hypothetical protein